MSLNDKVNFYLSDHILKSRISHLCHCFIWIFCWECGIAAFGNKVSQCFLHDRWSPSLFVVSWFLKWVFMWDSVF